MDKNNDNFSIQDAYRLAQTEEAQALLQQLRASGGDALQDALNKAAAGDSAQAVKLLSSLLRDEQAQALLRRLGGSTP